MSNVKVNHVAKKHKTKEIYDNAVVLKNEHYRNGQVYVLVSKIGAQK